MKKSDNISRIELVALHFVKELKAIFSDRGAILILMGAMLIYPLLYSVGYFNETLTDLGIGVVDLDHTELSRKYTQMIDATPELNVTFELQSLKEAKDLFMQNKIKGVVLIENGFQKSVLSGDQANVAVYADASYFLKYRNEYLAVAYTNAYFSGGISVKKYMLEGNSIQQAKISSDPLPVFTHILYNPASSYGSFVMPGIILIIIQQTLLIGIGLMGGSFSESKDSPFLLPISNRTREIIPYLAGKSGAYLAVTIINIAFAVFMVHHWFNYPDKASALDILMLLLPYALAVISLGIGISTLFKHRESAIVFMVFLSPIALFLSGLSWPTSAIPEWLVAISKVLPSTNVIPAYLRLRIMGVGMEGIKHDLLQVYGQAAAYMILVAIYFTFRIFKEKRRSKLNNPE